MAINLSLPINRLGYGYVGLNLLRAFEEAGAEPALWNLGPIDVLSEDVGLVQAARNRVEAFDFRVPSLRVFHQFDLAQHVGRGLRCGFPIFELDSFRSDEMVHLQSQDVLVVASKWASEVLQANLRNCPAIHVAPLGVNREIFFPAHGEPKPGPTRFMNCGKWELRKGHDVLCDAFNLAFEKDDNVELVMNCYNPCFQERSKRDSYNAEWFSYYKESKLGEKMDVLTTRLDSQQEVAELMRTVDCGVFPSRAEGWNLDAAEMMAMGKQVIVTDYSAHREYCNSDNARLIPFSGCEVAHDGVWFDANDSRWGGRPGRWMDFGETQMDALIEHMRAVHKLKQEGASLHNQAGIDSMRSLTWGSCAAGIYDFVNGHN